MGFIYEETNHYGVEAIVALERYCTPSDEKTCTAATEATRICETYGIPERELLPLVRPLQPSARPSLTDCWTTFASQRSG